MAFFFKLNGILSVFSTTYVNAAAELIGGEHSLFHMAEHVKRCLYSDNTILEPGYKIVPLETVATLDYLQQENGSTGTLHYRSA